MSNINRVKNYKCPILVKKNKEKQKMKKWRKICVPESAVIHTTIEANQKLSSTVTILFLRGRKIKISLVFITKSFIPTFISIPKP